MGMRSMAYGQDGGNMAMDFMRGMQAGNALGDSLAGLDMQSRLNRMARQVQEAGGDISALDAAQIASPRDMMALGAFQEQYLKTREGQSKIYEAHNKLAEQQYNMLAGALDYLDQVQADPIQWGTGVEAVSRRLNLPYNVRFDRERGDFEVLYQGEDGKEASTGQRMSRDDMAALAGEWRNGRAFTHAYAQHAMTLIEGNIAAKKDPSAWLRCTDAQGREVTLVPQRQPVGGGGIEMGYLVMQPGKGADFVPFDQLGERGISMRSVEQALQEQNARLQIERNKVGLQSDRMNLAILGKKWEQARNGTTLTREDEDFINGLCLGKDEATGRPVYDSAKASGLALLMGSGIDRYAAVNLYEENLHQMMAMVRQSPRGEELGEDEARALAARALLQRIQGGGSGMGQPASATPAMPPQRGAPPESPAAVDFAGQPAHATPGVKRPWNGSSMDGLKRWVTPTVPMQASH